MHDAPVKELASVPEMNLLVTQSWDKTLRYWDTRQPNPVHIQQLPERCYALAVRYPLMVVGTANRNVVVLNLQNPQVIFNDQKRIQGAVSHGISWGTLRLLEILGGIVFSFCTAVYATFLF